MQTQTTVFPAGPANPSVAGRLLTAAAFLWLLVVTAGQWLFGFYILGFYGGHALTGAIDKWNNVLPHGYVKDDFPGNTIVGIHVLTAAILVIGGPLQLIPQLRRYTPRFHRRLGRLYVLIAVLVSMAGLVMVWTRGAVGDLIQHINISIQAIYIAGFAWMTFQNAKAGQFAKHRIWALRLFMVVSGVWFFRIGLMFWLISNGGPAGFDPESFSGPFLTVLSVITYSVPLPLILLELYLYAQRKARGVLPLLTAAVIFLFTIVLATGILGAARGMWFPRL